MIDIAITDRCASDYGQHRILPGCNLIWFIRTPFLQEIDLGIADWIKDPEDGIQSYLFEISSDWVYPRRQKDLGYILVVYKTMIFSKPQCCALYNYDWFLERCGPSSQSKFWTGSGIFQSVKPSEPCGSVFSSSNSRSQQCRCKCSLIFLLGL